MYNKLTALVITYNEEDNIKGFLENVSFADEIILVDSYSDDRTVEIARTFPKVKIIQRKFTNFSDQKNYAIAQSSNNWVLFFDADERMDNDLRKEILEKVSSDNSLCAYYIYRRFYFKKKHIKYSGWQNDKAVRLFRKDQCRYNANRFVHEQMICNCKIGNLKNRLDHYSFNTKEVYVKKLKLYAKLRAQELARKNLQPNLIHTQIKPVYRFFQHYVLRLGFLDGKEGLTIANIYAEHIRDRYKFLKEIYQNQDDVVNEKFQKEVSLEKESPYQN